MNNEHYLTIRRTNEDTEIHVLKDNLKGIEWDEDPFLEPADAFHDNLTLYSSNKKEYYCAEGIIQSIWNYRKNCGTFLKETA